METVSTRQEPLFPSLKQRWLRVCCLLVLAALTSLPAQAAPEAPHISASGEGELRVAPDVADISIAVSHTDKSVAKAREKVEMVTRKVIEAARAQGLSDADIRSSQLTIAPDYAWEDGRRRLRGQRVERRVQLHLKDLGRYAELLDAVAEAEVSRLHQTSLGFSDRAALEREALVMAVKAARQRAEAMAQAANARLGEVYQIVESGGGHAPQPMMRAMAMDKAESSESAPMLFGEELLVKQVSVIWYLESD